MGHPVSGAFYPICSGYSKGKADINHPVFWEIIHLLRRRAALGIERTGQYIHEDGSMAGHFRSTGIVQNEAEHLNRSYISLLSLAAELELLNLNIEKIWPLHDYSYH